MTSISSVLRITVAELGAADDQTAVKAFLSVVKPDGFGIVTDVGAFAVRYRNEAMAAQPDGTQKLRTVRAFRSPWVFDETDRWRSVPQFAPLAPVKPEQGWWLTQWALDRKAAAQTAWNDASRYLEIPMGADWRLPPPSNPQQADFGFLVDDDLTGLSGIETLGLRRARPDEIDVINRRAGYNPNPSKADPRQSAAAIGDWIMDGATVRTVANNDGSIMGRGAGGLPAQRMGIFKRSGLVFPDDLLNGWDEAKALCLPNNACGEGALAERGYRVEHPTAAQRPGFPYGYGRRPGVTVPEGTRFYSTRPMNGSNGILRWADDENLTGALRTSAINCAVGSANLGLVDLETSGIAGVESVGRGFNPLHTAGFDQAGVKTTADGFRLMRRFWVPEFTKVAAAPPAGARR